MNDAYNKKFFADALDRVRVIPGVRSADAVRCPPLEGACMGWTTPYSAEGRPEPPETQKPWTFVNMITPGYFQTMQIPLLAGRYFTASDDGRSGQVVIVNRILARKLYPDGNAVGKRMQKVTKMVTAVQHYSAGCRSSASQAMSNSSISRRSSNGRSTVRRNQPRSSRLCDCGGRAVRRCARGLLHPGSARVPSGCGGVFAASVGAAVTIVLTLRFRGGGPGRRGRGRSCHLPKRPSGRRRGGVRGRLCGRHDPRPPGLRHRRRLLLRFGALEPQPRFHCRSMPVHISTSCTRSSRPAPPPAISRRWCGTELSKKRQRVAIVR